MVISAVAVVVSCSVLEATGGVDETMDDTVVDTSAPVTVVTAPGSTVDPDAADDFSALELELVTADDSVAIETVDAPVSVSDVMLVPVAPVDSETPEVASPVTVDVLSAVETDIDEAAPVSDDDVVTASEIKVSDIDTELSVSDDTTADVEPAMDDDSFDTAVVVTATLDSPSVSELKPVTAVAGVTLPVVESASGVSELLAAVVSFAADVVADPVVGPKLSVFVDADSVTPDDD